MSKYEIIDHGYTSSQYFTGCSTAYTGYEYCVTGGGYNAKEAYQDAVEQIYMSHGDEAKRLHLPKRPKGIRASDCVPSDMSGPDDELYWYVSIRYTL